MSYHDNMEKQIRVAFPQFNDKQVRYAINKVSNYIRDCRQDVCQVWVDNKRTSNAQYSNNSTVQIGRVDVHIEIQVD